MKDANKKVVDHQTTRDKFFLNHEFSLNQSTKYSIMTEN